MMYRIVAVFLAICLPLAAGGVSLPGEKISEEMSMERIPRRGGRDFTQRPSREGSYEAGVLLATVENGEQAQEIAELYGIELVSVEGGLAKYHTELDIMELIQLGRENDWPPVQPNWIYTLF